MGFPEALPIGAINPSFASEARKFDEIVVCLEASEQWRKELLWRSKLLEGTLFPHPAQSSEQRCERIFAWAFAVLHIGVDLFEQLICLWA